MLKKFIQCLPFSFILALIGFTIGSAAWYYNFDRIGTNLIIPATLGALVTGALFWWLFIAFKQKYTCARGFWAGAISGLVAHPITWYFDIIRANLCYHIFQWGSCAHCPIPMNLLVGINGSLLFSYASLYYWGWLTIPASALIGIGLIFIHNLHQN